MPLIITLSHTNAPKDHWLLNHPHSAPLWTVPLYVKQCADDKVDLVMLAHHPAAWKTHKREHGHTRTPSNADFLVSPVTCVLLLYSPPQKHTLTQPHTRTHTHAHLLCERQRAPCMSELYPNTTTVATYYNYYQMDLGKTY